MSLGAAVSEPAPAAGDRLLPDASDVLDRIRAAARRFADGSSTPAASTLRLDQQRVVLDFAAFVADAATGRLAGPPFARVVLPPRTGKTVIAAHLIAGGGFDAVVIVPTRALPLPGNERGHAGAAEDANGDAEITHEAMRSYFSGLAQGRPRNTIPMELGKGIALMMAMDPDEYDAVLEDA